MKVKGGPERWQLPSKGGPGQEKPGGGQKTVGAVKPSREVAFKGALAMEDWGGRIR